MNWAVPVPFGPGYYVSQEATVPQEVRVPVTRPRTARVVGRVSWNWSPANSRLDTLLISLDRGRRFYLLWLEWADDGFSDSRVVAYVPRGGQSETEAAAALIVSCYRGEAAEFGDQVGGPWEVWSSGLLSREELAGLAHEIWPLKAPAPLQP